MSARAQPAQGEEFWRFFSKLCVSHRFHLTFDLHTTNVFFVSDAYKKNIKMHKPTLRATGKGGAAAARPEVKPQQYLINEPSHLRTPGILPKGHPMAASIFSGDYDPQQASRVEKNMPQPVKSRGYKAFKLQK
jgi:hypothetical protein